MFKMFEAIFTAVSVILMIIIIYLTIKTRNAYKNQKKIMDAIYLYGVDTMKKYGRNHFQVSFDDMESYNDTLYRFWDWGYTRILPKEKFEIIKPYIQ